MRFDDLITQAKSDKEKGGTHVLVPIELLLDLEIALDAGELFAGTRCVQEKEGEQTLVPNPGCTCNVCVARKCLGEVGIFLKERTKSYGSGVQEMFHKEFNDACANGGHKSVLGCPVCRP